MGVFDNLKSIFISKPKITPEPNYELPNGIPIWSLNDMETRVLYREMFEEKSYWKHGVELKDGQTVVDVGANIGMFSMYVAHQFRNLKIFAFEPIPTLFALLQRNTNARVFEKGGSDTEAKGGGSALLPKPSAHGNIFQVGLSNKAGTAEFQFDRYCSFASSSYVSEIMKFSFGGGHGLIGYLKALTKDLQTSRSWPEYISAPVLQLLDVPVAKYFIALPLIMFWACVLLRSLLHMEHVPCQLRPLSDIIKEENITSIDLLKIDVEGAEMAVVEGINESDWSKIRQMVIEVHDIDGRVDKMSKLFREHGFEVFVDQEDWAMHVVSRIYTLFARKAT